MVPEDRLSVFFGAAGALAAMTVPWLSDVPDSGHLESQIFGIPKMIAKW